MTTKKSPAPKKPEKVRTCAAHRPRWKIPGQPDCKLATIRPAAALCAKHDAMWKAAGGRAQWREAKAAESKAEPKKLSAKARRDEYSAIVARLEAEGATTSDAQAAADIEVHERGICDPKTCPLHLAAKTKRSKPPVSA